MELSCPSYPVWLDPSEQVNLRRVAPGLYVGAEGARTRSPGGRVWDLVVDMSGSDVPVRTLRVLSRPMEDGQPVRSEVFEEVVREVRTARARRGRVLVHCAMGLSRSVSVAYGLLRRLDGLGHDEALRRVKVEGPFPVPQTLDSVRALMRMGSAVWDDRLDRVGSVVRAWTRTEESMALLDADVNLRGSDWGAGGCLVLAVALARVLPGAEVCGVYWRGRLQHAVVAWDGGYLDYLGVTRLARSVVARWEREEGRRGAVLLCGAQAVGGLLAPSSVVRVVAAALERVVVPVVRGRRSA